jgi:hypothetical protein
MQTPERSRSWRINIGSFRKGEPIVLVDKGEKAGWMLLGVENGWPKSGRLKGESGVKLMPVPNFPECSRRKHKGE